MRRLALVASLMLACAGACAAAAPEPPHRVFALVAAMGDWLSAVHEVQSTGSHLAPYRRRALRMPDDGINKLVLGSLDAAVKSVEPSSDRVYLSVRVPKEAQDRPSSLDSAAFAFAVGILRKMPERERWSRIIVVTPAWRTRGDDGLARGMQGLGVFTEPLCQGGDNPQQPGLRPCDTRSRPATQGVRAHTPGGETEAAARYVAPYLFAKVWILDPATLAVVDTQEIFDHEKLFDPDSTAVDVNRMIDPKTLAARIERLVETSTLEAVRRSELRGTVDVKERGEVNPAR